MKKSKKRCAAIVASLFILLPLSALLAVLLQPTQEEHAILVFAWIGCFESLSLFFAEMSN